MSIKSSYVCPVCLIEFSDYRSENRKYCSLKCSHNGARRAIRPTGKEILAMLTTMTWKQIASGYGVSDNTVRAWAKRSGIMDEYYRRIYT